MIVLLIFAYIIVVACCVFGVQLAIRSAIQWHREDTPAHPITQQDLDTRLNYGTIRKLEMQLYGRYFTRWDGSMIDPDSPEGLIQEKRNDNNRAYNPLAGKDEPTDSTRYWKSRHDDYQQSRNSGNTYGYAYPSSLAYGYGWDTYGITDHNYD